MIARVEFSAVVLPAMAVEVLEVLSRFGFELRAGADSENVSPAKQLVASDEVQADAVVVRIECGDALAKIGFEKPAFLHVAVKPKQPRVEFLVFDFDS